jgi:hypothetical protein
MPVILTTDDERDVTRGGMKRRWQRRSMTRSDRDAWRDKEDKTAA